VSTPRSDSTLTPTLSLPRERGLARLSLEPEEQEHLGEQLSAILRAFNELQSVDTEGVEPTAQAAFGAGALREDEVRPSLGPERAIANAPQTSGTSFSVPTILE
jgi:aspartyl-tRNA(Asn)/glutamyl-tRNA(Gln) amidotransferase subunit C